MKTILKNSPIVPVVVADNVEQGVKIAEALVEGGMVAIEITLRTPSALSIIAAVAKQFPKLMVGAGTVLNPNQLQEVQKAGAKFAVSPGSTPALLKAAKDMKFPLLPGIATASEIMQGIDLGYDCFKLFPASAVGGVPLLKGFGGPFKEVTFCPTGGINENNFLEYLNLDNVVSVGGTWLTPVKSIKDQNWQDIVSLAKASLAKL
ncbi:MAG: bifunctional 4-hydroxy-2-oxoglutarate aldolase/2-dehydro-3-deoxy-phosphogluconate aldolase [Oligoflexales bacterium]